MYCDRYNLKEIADSLGLHYTTVSKSVQRIDEQKWLFKPPEPKRLY